jgi:RNA polymerase sigma-70 factor (sigma-E family)
MTTTDLPPLVVAAVPEPQPASVPDPDADGALDAPLAAYVPDFDAFYRATYPGVVAVAHSMTGDRHLGEEIAQEAFIAAHRRWAKVRRLDRPDLWVRRVAVNRCTTTWRRKLIERRVNGQIAAGTPTLQDGAGDARLAGDELWAAVRRLPDRQLTVVVLHYVDELSTAEIGELLGCTPSTVQTHLTRARERLGQLLHRGDTP